MTNANAAITITDINMAGFEIEETSLFAEDCAVAGMFNNTPIKNNNPVKSCVLIFMFKVF